MSFCFCYLKIDPNHETEKEELTLNKMNIEASNKFDSNSVEIGSKNARINILNNQIKSTLG